MVSDFHCKEHIPIGCNSSFITLIPKVNSPVLMSDFRPISLIGLQYKIIAKLLANRLAKVINSIVSPEQTAFIKGRQILDGPLLLNEVIDWYKCKKRKLMLFKIDFAKAYDSLSWDFLFNLLRIMGFGNKWTNWIKVCLTSARSSVLVNGSPTDEFPIQRGLRQGDPMAPFLFIIAMEGLHIALSNLVRNGLFSGAKINQVTVSHLFYADDVIVVGDWSESNLANVSNALRFFYGISGLKINFEKSSIIGVGVSRDEVSHLASMIGCKPEYLPFKYLGIPIGGSSKRVSTWDPIVNKFTKRLSGWKSNLLSIGGRSSLISSVLGGLGNYFFSIFRAPKLVIKKLEALRASFFWGGSVNKKKMYWSKWGSVLSAIDDGGIGIGSLNAMNMALLYKWRWRGLTNNDSLWARVVVDIHGTDCFLKMSAKSKGLWKNITDVTHSVHGNYNMPSNVISRCVGNGQHTKFWKDPWCGDMAFMSKYPRLFALEMDKDCSVQQRFLDSDWRWNWRRNIRSGLEIAQLNDLVQNLPNTLDAGADRWLWNFQGKSSFYVASIRRYIDHCSLPISSSHTLWNKRVPKKINIFVWRLLRNILPTQTNLFSRGIDIVTVSCNLCANGIDDLCHIFQACTFYDECRMKLSNWIHIDIPSLEPSGLVEWYKNLQLTSLQRDTLEAIMFIWWWHIWKERNNAFHNGSHARSYDMIQSIISMSFLWISNRDRKRNFTWYDWIARPLDVG